MGKGDKKTKRGKIIKGSYGARRLRKKKKTVVLTEKPVAKETKKKAAKVEAAPEKAAPEKETVKKEVKSGNIKIVPIKSLNIYREFNFVYLKDSDEEFVKNLISFCLK